MSNSAERQGWETRGDVPKRKTFCRIGGVRLYEEGDWKKGSVAENLLSSNASDRANHRERIAGALREGGQERELLKGREPIYLNKNASEKRCQKGE